MELTWPPNLSSFRLLRSVSTSGDLDRYFSLSAGETELRWNMRNGSKYSSLCSHCRAEIRHQDNKSPTKSDDDDDDDNDNDDDVDDEDNDE